MVLNWSAIRAFARAGKGWIGEVYRRTLGDVPLFVDREPEALALGKEHQTVPDLALVDPPHRLVIFLSRMRFRRTDDLIARWARHLAHSLCLARRALHFNCLSTFLNPCSDNVAITD